LNWSNPTSHEEPRGATKSPTGCPPPSSTVDSYVKDSRLGRLALTILLAFYGFSILKNPSAGSFVDNIDLPIHETGHIVFLPFGEFIQFAGGTLFQLIMPSVFLGYFLKRHDRHAATLALWWIAQNFWNISVYASDARAQELPLVGGGEHDWAYMLGRLGLLARDEAIGHDFWLIGVVLFLFSIAGGLIALTNTAAKGDESAELTETV
jgi:hypothetical protein